jgi:hypothetical protein
MDENALHEERRDCPRRAGDREITRVEKLLKLDNNAVRLLVLLVMGASGWFTLKTEFGQSQKDVLAAQMSIARALEKIDATMQKNFEQDGEIKVLQQVTATQNRTQEELKIEMRRLNDNMERWIRSARGR